MKRFSAFVVVTLAVVLAAGLAGCSTTRDKPQMAPRQSGSTGSGDSTGQAPGGSAGGGTAEEGDDSAEAPAFIPIEGVNEKAALDAIPNGLEVAKQMKAAGGLPPIPDLTGFEPRLEAYLLRGEMGTQMVLFQVGADGKAREMYKGTADPNPANLMIQDSSVVGLGPSTAPASDREKAAAAAVLKIMQTGFPGETVTVSIIGYRFLWETDPVTPYRLEIAPGGSVISTT